MVRKIEDLRNTPDEQLIAEHDAMAPTTVSGTSYYMDELQRRQVERSMKSSHKLAVASFVLAAVNAVVAVVAIVVAVKQP